MHFWCIWTERSLTQPAIKTKKKIPSESFVRNFNAKHFISCTIKENIRTCSSKHLILLYNVIFFDWKKSISINSDLSDIIGVLEEHCVISGFMGVSNMLNLGAAADSYSKFGIDGGNICDQADEIVGDTSFSASVPAT